MAHRYNSPLFFALKNDFEMAIHPEIQLIDFMKELPNTETLLELLKLAKEAEQKTRELYEKGDKFARKWELRLAKNNNLLEKIEK